MRTRFVVSRRIHDRCKKKHPRSLRRYMQCVARALERNPNAYTQVPEKRRRKKKRCPYGRVTRGPRKGRCRKG